MCLHVNNSLNSITKVATRKLQLIFIQNIASPSKMQENPDPFNSIQ